MSVRLPTVLICDEDRGHTELLALGLFELGYMVELTRSYAEAFAIACARDFDALVTAPFLRDSSALMLPAALGIRRPLVVVLASRMGERLDPVIVRRVGFDAQLAKVVAPITVDRMVRAARAHRLATEERDRPFGPRDHSDVRR